MYMLRIGKSTFKLLIAEFRKQKMIFETRYFAGLIQQLETNNSIINQL